MDHLVEKTQRVFERLKSAGFFEHIPDLDRVRERMLDRSAQWGSDLEAYTILRDTEVLLEFEYDDRLGFEDRGAFAWHIARLAALSNGEVDITDATDNLWVNRSRKTFQVEFNVNGRFHSVDFPQDPEADLYNIIGEVDSALNAALGLTACKKRFYGIMNIHREASGKVFATFEQVKALEDEGLIGKLGYRPL